MHARKIALSSFALVFGLALAGLAAASSDTPTSTDASKAPEKVCCKHHDAAAGAAGAHCDHAKMEAQGAEGKASCPKHAAMHKEGAEGKACCAQHAEMMKDGAPAAAKASCAKHGEMHKDGKKGCCCKDDCERAEAPEAPAKS